MLDLTFGPSFKVKRWFTGFGELSFRWIQICIGSPMHRSSLSRLVLICLTCGYYRYSGTQQENGVRFAIIGLALY